MNSIRKASFNLIKILLHFLGFRCNLRSLVVLFSVINLPLLYTAPSFAFSLDSLNYRVDTRATFAGGENTPFWLVSNIFGLGSPKFNNGFIRASIDKPLSSDKKFAWSVKADVVAQWNLPSSFRVQQLYGEIKYRYLSVIIGSKEYHPYYNNIRLSSGDPLFSGNALPIPQIRIGTYGFAPIVGTKGWLSINAFISYGMFTDSKWQRNWVEPGGLRASGVLYCGRGVWARIGNNKKFPLTVDLGVQMATQFGGISYQPNGEIIKMPTNPLAWIKAFIPLAGGKDTPENEQINIEGNMNGEYNISISYSPLQGLNIRPYWEHYFEDHSQMFTEYGWWKDGLWGIEISLPKNPFLSKFVYEYVDTRDQSGAILHNSTEQIPEQVSGRDGYYAHYLYGSWQNWGMSLGTPLAISPLYNRNHELYNYNTRFFAHHIGVEGNPLKGLEWRFLLTFTKNYGTYNFPLPEIMNNCSGLMELSYHFAKLHGFNVKGSIAWDKGPLLGNNFGGMISLGYEGNFSLKK